MVVQLGVKPMLNKQSTGRAKDLGDAEELRKRNPKPKQAD
jgi:hypothetical protein